MQKHYTLSVTSNDKPGVVEHISKTIESCEGSWLESRLAHLAGKFVGVVRVRVASAKADELNQNLKRLALEGINIHVEALPLPEADNTNVVNATFSAVGPDRIGIVKEIAAAFRHQGINVEELDTKLSSMPYSGDPIFEAHGLLSIPSHIDFKEFYDKMDTIANDLGLDLDVDTQRP